ncbi:DNA polymerase Y family protein [Prosthecomicrobium pneumaticum]|uniref:Y-family DNA polymerase n=1 Tax=Prosthecomicrobium pneumaticum TaxID=81895 RepID=UPI0031B62803
MRRKGSPAGQPADAPLVAVARIDNALRIVALDERATAAGLARRMALASARAIHPVLAVVEADPAADAALLERIADWCDRFTPLVALDPPSGLLLDVTGAAHLAGGERPLLDRVRAGLTAQGFHVQAALAGTAAAARALAAFADGTIAAPGREAEAVAGLPVGALGLDAETAGGLSRAGLKTIGAVAERTRHELAARFGAGLLARLDEALGRGERPITPRLPVPDYTAERRFAEPVATEDIIRDTLAGLAATLAGMMERRAEGARRVEASFFRADGAVRRLAVETGRPTRDPALLDRLFRERLEALADPLDPGFGFDLIRLAALRADPLDPAPATFDGREQEEGDVAALADRLAARLGPRRVLRFLPQDSHVPEASERLAPAQRSAAAPGWPTAAEPGEPPRRPLRLFSRPEPVEAIAEVPDGPPVRFVWRRAVHRVMRAEGPERIAMEWWRSTEGLPTRDYFRVEDQDGRRFWLYRDGIYGRETAAPRWYVQGLFG